MICAVKNENDFIFLDATDDGCIFGMPSTAIQDKQAMIGINEKEYKIVRVPVVAPEKNVLIDSTFMQINENNITGRIKVSMTGYYAATMHSVLNFNHGNDREEYLSSRFSRSSNKLKFRNWKVEETPGHESVTVTADFELSDYAKKLGDEYYVNMNIFKWYEHEEIDYPKRKIPIEYNFLKRSSYVTALTIPAGYTISFMPKSDQFKNDTWGYSMNYTTDQNHVFLSQQFNTDYLMLYPSSFESWNKVLEHLLPNYKQTITFRKK
jgi:hypothetical protein